jgi:dienelactone hydrolase
LAGAALVALTLGAAGLGSGAGAAQTFERVSFASGDQQIQASIAKPSDPGRFAAVVLLPGCGAQKQAERWLSMLADRGYVAIAPDRRKDVKRLCNRPSDALAALGYLRSLPYVAGDRVGVVGWADGGSAALAAVGRGVPDGGFSAAIAFNPGCTVKRYRAAVATRVFAAASGPRANDCRTLARRAGKKLRLTVYRRSADRPALTALAKDLPAASSQGSPSGWANAPLAADAPLAANQGAAGALRSQVAQFGSWVNTTVWSAPVYVVPADQPRIAIRVNSAYTPYGLSDRALLATDLDSVPLPDDASPAGPPESKTVPWSDHELIVYQPSTDTAWELYHLVKGQWGWSVTDGGRITHVSSSNGAYAPWITGKPHGMTASGIPLLAALQRVDELQQGSIDHAVAISVPHARKDAVKWPATRTDGDFTTPDAVTEGTRFRLPASLDIDSLALTPYAKMIAKAIQAHGMVVIDKNCRPSVASCPAVTFKAEDPRPRPDAATVNPYAAIFGGVPENHLFDNFPWDRLQVLE